MDRIGIMQKLNTHGLELDDLRVMQSLYETRNTTRTAEYLNKSQPGVSRVLARLRRALGDPLLVRAPGGMVLTDRALALRDQLTEVLTGIEGFLAPNAFDPAQAQRVFRLSTTDYGALAILPGWKRRIRCAFGRSQCVTPCRKGQGSRSAPRGQFIQTSPSGTCRSTSPRHARF